MDTILIELQQCDHLVLCGNTIPILSLPDELRRAPHLYIFMNENKDVRFTHRRPLWSRYLSTVAVITLMNPPCVSTSECSSSTPPAHTRNKRKHVSDS